MLSSVQGLVDENYTWGDKRLQVTARFNLKWESLTLAVKHSATAIGVSESMGPIS